jgi:hypothetical protein
MAVCYWAAHHMYCISISLEASLLRIFFSIYFFASLFNFQYFLLDVLFIRFAHAQRFLLVSLSLSLYFDNFWKSPIKWIEVHVIYECRSTRDGNSGIFGVLECVWRGKGAETLFFNHTNLSFKHVIALVFCNWKITSSCYISAGILIRLRDLRIGNLSHIPRRSAISSLKRSDRF